MVLPPRRVLSRRSAPPPVSPLFPQPLPGAGEYRLDLLVHIFPKGLGLVRLQQPYVKGLHRHGESRTQIYVSQGTGFWGPPMRLGTVCEITEIILKAEG